MSLTDWHFFFFLLWFFSLSFSFSQKKKFDDMDRGLLIWKRNFNTSFLAGSVFSLAWTTKREMNDPSVRGWWWWREGRRLPRLDPLFAILLSSFFALCGKKAIIIAFDRTNKPKSGQADRLADRKRLLSNDKESLLEREVDRSRGADWATERQESGVVRAGEKLREREREIWRDRATDSAPVDIPPTHQVTWLHQEEVPAFTQHPPPHTHELARTHARSLSLFRSVWTLSIYLSISLPLPHFSCIFPAGWGRKERKKSNERSASDAAPPPPPPPPNTHPRPRSLAHSPTHARAELVWWLHDTWFTACPRFSKEKQHHSAPIPPTARSLTRLSSTFSALAPPPSSYSSDRLQSMQPQNVAVADSSGKLARRPSLVIFAGSPETAILLPAINNPSPTDALMEMTAGGAYKVTVGIIIPSSLSTAAMSASPPSSRTSAVVDQTSGDSATGGAVVCKRLSVQLKVYQVSRKQGPMPAMTSTSTHTGSASAIPKFPRSSSSPNFSLHYQRGHSFSTTSLPSLPFRPGQSSSQLETLGQRRPPSVVSSLSMPETRDVKERIIELQSIEHLLWEDEKTMSPGSYETTFTFFVPSNVPPSYSSPVAQGRDIFHVLSAVLEVEGQPRPIKVQRRISVRQCSWSIPPHLLSKASVRTIRMDDVRAVVSVTPQVSMDEEILVSLNLSSARSDLNLRFKSLQAFLMEKHVTRSKSFEEEVEVQVSPTLNYEPRRRMIRPNFEIPNSRSSSPGDSDGSDSSSPFDSDTVQFRFRPLEYSGHDAESADFVHQAPTPNVHIPRFASVTHFVRVTLRYSRQYKTGGSAQSSSNAVSRSEIESIHDVPVILIAPPSPLWTPMEIALSGKMKPERTTAGQPRQTERHPRTPPTMRLWGRLESLDSASGRLRRSNSSRSKSRRTPKLVPNDDAVSILSTASSLNLGFEVNEKSLLTYALKATHSQNPFSPRSESSKSPLASAPPSPLPGRFNSAPSPSRSQRLPTTGDDGRVDSALLSVESGKAPSRSLDLSKVTGNLVPSPARPHRRSPLGRPTSEDVSQTADVVSKSLSEQKAVSQAGANKQVAPINGEYHDGNHGSGIHVFSPRTSPADSPATNNAISAHPYHPAKTSLESYASDETAVSPLPHATFIPVETSKSKTEQEIPTPSALIGGFEGFPSGTKPRAVSLSTATLSSAHPARLPIHSILSAGPIPSFGSAGISANPIPPDLSGKSQSLEASTALPPSPSLSIEHNPPAKSPTVAAAAASTNRDTVPSTPASETAPNDRGGSWTWLKRGLSLRIGKKKV